MALIKMSRKIVKVNNVNIFFRDTNTNLDSILCLHGRWGRGETWVDFIQHYGNEYRVIAPDQRGHGLSGKPDSTYSTKEMAEDMISLLDNLGINKSIVVGHSMGGAIAGYLGANYPNRVRALAILDKSASGPINSKGPSINSVEIVDPVTKNWPLPFKSLKEAQGFIREQMESELSYQYFMNSLEETVEGYQMMFSQKAMAANIAHYEEWYYLLPKIKCPVLLIQAKGGEAVSDNDFSKMKTMISNCMAREISDPDHNIYLSKKEEFYQYFDEFLGILKKVG
jgi:pimeloyl-ACP methyl ester carboxylesterase